MRICQNSSSQLISLSSAAQTELLHLVFWQMILLFVAGCCLLRLNWQFRSQNYMLCDVKDLLQYSVAQVQCWMLLQIAWSAAFCCWSLNQGKKNFENSCRLRSWVFFAESFSIQLLMSRISFWESLMIDDWVIAEFFCFHFDDWLIRYSCSFNLSLCYHGTKVCTSWIFFEDWVCNLISWPLGEVFCGRLSLWIPSDCWTAGVSCSAAYTRRILVVLVDFSNIYMLFKLCIQYLLLSLSL